MGGDGDLSVILAKVCKWVWFKELRGAKGAGQITPDYSISQGLQVGCDMEREVMLPLNLVLATVCKR